MGKITTIAKNITETAAKTSWTATAGNIELEAAGRVAMQSKEKIVYTTYTAPEEKKDFGVKLTHMRTQYFTPLGIKNPSRATDNTSGEIDILFDIQKSDAKEYIITIYAKGSSDVYFKSHTLQPVTVSNNGNAGNSASDKYPPGSYVFHWDGASSEDIIDTAILKKGVTVEIEATGMNGTTAKDKKDFTGDTGKVDWVDVKLDKNKKQIDVQLRVSLKDGGAEGLDSYDKVPKDKVAARGVQPLRARSRSFDQLQQMALDGLTKHWSRISSNNAGKGITVNGEQFQVFVHPKNTTENSMDDISLIFNTNGEWMRSRNPGTVSGIVSLVGNFLSERIAYNAGYLEYSNGWGYQQESDEDKTFTETAAHEIGHEILKDYNGDNYSYKHKGSSTYSDTKPVSEGGEEYPQAGEIDLMKYYNDEPYNKDYSRIVAAEEDVTGLVWLSGIKYNQ